MFGDCLVSLPLAVYGGICAEDEESYFALLKAGSDLANRLQVKYLEMRNRTEPFDTVPPRTGPIRDVYAGSVARSGEVASRAAAGHALHRAEVVESRPGVDGRPEDRGVLRDLRRKCSSTGHAGILAEELFVRLRKEFPNQCRLFGVRKGRKQSRACFVFTSRTRCCRIMAGALPEYNRDSPNNFMYWSLMAQSCSEGIRHFDFGRSKRGTGSFKFKSAWSMQVTRIALSISAGSRRKKSRI